MTYDYAIAFWYERINYEVKAASPSDLKLERMRALLRLLGDPHEQFRSVHITGTKGKGSTAAMLATVLQTAGYRVGLFTSPHLVHVEERIQLNGIPISHPELAAFDNDQPYADQLWPAIDARDDRKELGAGNRDTDAQIRQLHA